MNNPKKGTVRAWHGHKIEAKLVKVLKGEFVVCTIKIDNWESPNKGIESTKFTLNENSGIVFIPPGYANGAINLLNESSIMYFPHLLLKTQKTMITGLIRNFGTHGQIIRRKYMSEKKF